MVYGSLQPIMYSGVFVLFARQSGYLTNVLLLCDFQVDNQVLQWYGRTRAFHCFCVQMQSIDCMFIFINRFITKVFCYA